MEDDENPNSKEEIEAKISRAMQSRVNDFREQADSLTLEGVRRALEKDLAMKALSLDVHKRFIKQCLEKFFYGADDKSSSKTSEKSVEEAAQPTKEEASIKEDVLVSSGGNNDSSHPDEKEKESSVLVVKEPSDDETDKSERLEINEDAIKKAIKERADHFRANSETITLLGVRRLLEEDLKLATNALDAYKRFINKELDEVLSSPLGVEVSNGVKKKSLKKSSQSISSPKAKRGSKRVRQSLDSDDVPSEDEEIDEVVTGPKKKVARVPKPATKESVKKKKPTEETRPYNSSQKKKPVGPDSDKDSEAADGNSSEDGHSHSSAEGVKAKREKPTQPAYGKQVEHLKSIIKLCGMGVPPSVYRKAKQVPETKRESFLIKELEDMLEKEGLSTNPSEKEIKAVKKKKERAKELEGIDMSNIVSSTRRRSTSSYIPLPKPKVEVESEEDEEDGKDEEDEEDDDNEEATDNGSEDGGESTDAGDEDGEEESD